MSATKHVWFVQGVPDDPYVPRSVYSVWLTRKDAEAELRAMKADPRNKGIDELKVVKVPIGERRPNRQEWNDR